MSAEEIKKMDEDIKAGKNVVSGDAEISQSSDYAKAKEETKEEVPAEEAKENDDELPTPDVKIAVPDEESETEEPEIQAEAEEEPPAIAVPGLDELNGNLPEEDPMINTPEPDALAQAQFGAEDPMPVFNNAPVDDVPMQGPVFENMNQGMTTPLATESAVVSSTDEFEGLLSKYMNEAKEEQPKERKTLLPQSREESDKMIDMIFETRTIPEIKSELKQNFATEVEIRKAVKDHLLSVRNEPMHRNVQRANDKLISIISAEEPLENLMEENNNDFNSGVLQQSDDYGYVATGDLAQNQNNDMVNYEANNVEVPVTNYGEIQDPQQGFDMAA